MLTKIIDYCLDISIVILGLLLVAGIIFWVGLIALVLIVFLTNFLI